LQLARQLRDSALAELAQGKNPAQEKKQRASRSAEKSATTVEGLADAYIAKRRSENASPATLAKYSWALGALPNDFKKMQVGEVTTRAAINAIKPTIEAGSYDKAKRVGSLIRAVLDRGVALGEIDNAPSLHLRSLVPSAKAVSHPAITDPDALFELLRAIEAYPSITIRNGLLLLAHTFVRPGELRHARWDEISFKERLWTIPADRTKMRREHLVFLTDETLSLLSELRALGLSRDLILPGNGRRSPYLSENTFNHVLWRLGYKDRHTAHGFRATASTLLHEYGFDPHAIEAQLAHVEPNAVKRAYNRAHYFDARTDMLQRWSLCLTHCNSRYLENSYGEAIFKYR
jgi:integrase